MVSTPNPTPRGSARPVRELLKRLRSSGYRPKRHLGQNFITDPNLLRAIVRDAELEPEDQVLEVGPGTGWLTRLSAEEAGRVVAVEIDPSLFAHCQKTLGHLTHLTLIQGDALKSKNRLNPELLEALSDWPGPLKVVANLPFVISSPLLILLYESPLRPARSIVTLQMEVAERLVAAPGSKTYGLLTVLIGYYAVPTLSRQIAAKMFLPPPKVSAAVVRIDPRPTLPPCPYPVFKQIAKALFSHRRKTLSRGLRTGLNLPADGVAQAIAAAGLDPKARVEQLSIDQIGLLGEAAVAAKILDPNGPPKLKRS